MSFRDWMAQHDPQGWSILALGLLIFMGPIIFWVLRMQLKQDHFMSELGRMIGAPEIGFFSNPNRVAGAVDGIPCACHYTQPSRYSSAIFKIRLLRPFLTTRVTQSNGGPNSEAITEGLARSVSLRGIDADDLRNALADPRRGEALTQIQSSGGNMSEFVKNLDKDTMNRMIEEPKYRATMLRHAPRSDYMVGRLEASNEYVEIILTDFGEKIDLEKIKKLVHLLAQFAGDVS